MGHCQTSRRSQSPGPAGSVALLQAVRIALEMGVVVDEPLIRIELVDRQAAVPAGEEPRDGPRLDSQNWCVSRCQDVDRLVLPAAGALVVVRPDEGVLTDPFDRNQEPPVAKLFDWVRADGCRRRCGPVFTVSGCGGRRFGRMKRRSRVGAPGRRRRRKIGKNALSEALDGGRALEAIAKAIGTRPDEVAEPPDGDEITKTPARNPALAAAAARRSSRFVLMPQGRKLTFVPGRTSAATLSASQFVSRTHPCDSVLPMRDGSGVPCRP